MNLVHCQKQEIPRLKTKNLRNSAWVFLDTPETPTTSTTGTHATFNTPGKFISSAPVFFFLEAPILNEIEFPLFRALILKIFILPLALQKEIGGGGGQTVLVLSGN